MLRHLVVLCNAGLPLTGLGLSSGVPSARPMLPSRGRNTIDDDTFFDSLGQLLSQVGPCSFVLPMARLTPTIL